MKNCIMFDNPEMNALADAFVAASEAVDFKDEAYKIYDYLKECPKTSLVVELVQSLNHNGFQITRK